MVSNKSCARPWAVVVDWASRPATGTTKARSRFMTLGTPSGQNTLLAADNTTAHQVMRACETHQDPFRGQTMSLRFFSSRIFTTFRSVLALNMVSSPVKGLTPLRALVANFRTTTSFIMPGTIKHQGRCDVLISLQDRCLSSFLPVF
jgi:hypothetical protein